ncbi:hypothetical protein TIFTF001_023347 [Ficus carica]|uniref:Uncharacterized protein n=1 Tax=Ficus carica TaxID=3494 RepID=A0AA88AKQ6_FICCA|nr:hypothetical protein TIFTF001_023347 [Ficus carica]
MYEYILSVNMMQVCLNEEKKTESQLGSTLEPPSIPSNSSSHVGQESASTSAIVSPPPECSSPSAASQRTAEQSAARVNSGSLIQQLDFDKTYLCEENQNSMACLGLGWVFGMGIMIGFWDKGQGQFSGRR